MQEHPLEALQRLIRGFSEDTTQATPLDTATVLEHTGIPSLRQIRPWIRACNAALERVSSPWNRACWPVDQVARCRGVWQKAWQM